MSDTVTVRVLREHSGDYGHKVAGDTYETSRGHANELAASGLVKIAGGQTPSRAKAKAAPRVRNKAEPRVRNKAAPAPAPAPAPPVSGIVVDPAKS